MSPLPQGGGAFVVSGRSPKSLAQRTPIACREVEAYAPNMKVTTIEHRSDDWHSTYLGWIVLAVMLTAMLGLALLV